MSAPRSVIDNACIVADDARAGLDPAFVREQGAHNCKLLRGQRYECGRVMQNREGKYQ